MRKQEKAAAAPNPNGDTKTLIVETRMNELRKITIPKHWRVTFGPMVPGVKEGGKAALRLYDGEDQKACFTDVNSFREEGIELLERVTKTKKQAVTRHTPTGDRQVIAEMRVTEWRDPDSPDDGEVAQEDNEFLHTQIEDMR